MKLSNIKVNPNNPRVIKDVKFDKLLESLREFPEMMKERPLVLVTDTDGKLMPLGGNMRLRALRELKYTDISDEWVSIVDDWTEEQKRQFIVKDNLSYGEWDWDLLTAEYDKEELIEWGMDLYEFEDGEEIEEKEEKTNDGVLLNIEFEGETEKTAFCIESENLINKYNAKIKG
jgi:ParB-like chromosome segregation protein Spo0J